MRCSAGSGARIQWVSKFFFFSGRRGKKKGKGKNNWFFHFSFFTLILHWRLSYFYLAQFYSFVFKRKKWCRFSYGNGNCGAVYGGRANKNHDNKGNEKEIDKESDDKIDKNYVNVNVDVIDNGNKDGINSKISDSDWGGRVSGRNADWRGRLGKVCVVDVDVGVNPVWYTQNWPFCWVYK